jgi:glycosyltransferase involved in cell wall biosynthesis
VTAVAPVLARPLRLLAFGISWPPETFLQRKLLGLARVGLDVTAAVRAKGRPSGDHLPGVRVIAMGALTPATLGAMLRAPARTARAVADVSRYGPTPWSRRLRRLRNITPLVDLQPDVVHFEWNSAAIDYFPFIHLWRAPIVISCRGTQIFVRPHVNGGYAELLRRTFDAAAAVHCVCDAIRDEAVSLGLDASKTVVIRPAVDTREFTPASHEPGPVLHLLAVGALTWRKGYEYALRTLRRVLDHGVTARLSIVGAGEEVQRLRCAIDEMRLREHVILCGTLAPMQIRELLREADVFLHSSLGEGISNSVLEAMACGVPIVTTEAGGMREAVTDGQEGFVLAARDVDGAARAIEHLAQDAALRRIMGARARATAEARFDLPDQVAQFKALYERLAQTRMAPA